MKISEVESMGLKIERVMKNISIVSEIGLASDDVEVSDIHNADWRITVEPYKEAEYLYNVYNKHGAKLFNMAELDDLVKFFDGKTMVKEIKQQLETKWISVFTLYRIAPEGIIDEMVDDVLDTADVENFNDSDIDMAFQRVLKRRLDAYYK